MWLVHSVSFWLSGGKWCSRWDREARVCSVCICIWAAWAVLCGSVSMPLHAPMLSLLLFVSTPHPCSLCACCMAVEKDWGSTSVLIVFLSRWHEFSQWSSAGGLGPPTEVVCQIFAL